MAGDNNVGGGGSVRWELNADQVDKGLTSDTHSGPERRGTHNQQGEDQDGEIDVDFFQLIVKRPNPGDPGAGNFDNELQWVQAGNTMVCRVRIRRDRKQIRIHWPA